MTIDETTIPNEDGHETLFERERRASARSLTPRPALEHPTTGVGIGCPRCGCCDLRVIYVDRRRQETVRRRECRHCGRRLTTIEKRLIDS